MKAVTPKYFRRLGKGRRELEAPEKRSQELDLYLCILILIALIAALAAFAIFYPRTTLIIIGAFVLFFTIAVLRYHHWRSKLPPPTLSPPTPLRCPACGSEQLDILSCGLWSGQDAQGQGTGGAFHYALCKQCGSRCAQSVDGHPYVPTEEEWKQHFDPIEKRRKDMQQWPFISEDQPPRNESNTA
jgi:hypothetical protein